MGTTGRKLSDMTKKMGHKPTRVGRWANREDVVKNFWEGCAETTILWMWGYKHVDGMLTNIMADVNQQIPWMAEQQPANMVKYVNTSTDWHLRTMAIRSSKADNQKIMLQRQHGGYPTPSQLVNVQVIVGVPFSTIPFYLDLIGRMKKSQRGPPWYNQHWSKWGMHIQLAWPKAWKPDIPLESFRGQWGE